MKSARKGGGMMKHVVALSGGKDSCCLALRMAEVEPRDYIFLTTPTGDELPEMLAHWDHLESLLGKPLTRITNGTLNSLIEEFGALPNWRQRWCTRRLKIEPCLAFLKANHPATLYVGLRADEEERKGIYSEDVTCRFPLREWGWGLPEVQGYLKQRGVRIPSRTDCARCYGQRLHEWRNLWEKHPAIYAEAEEQEARTGHTFRSPRRDTKPAPLSELRMYFQQQPSLGLEEEDGQGPCRVCSL
jgi:3'-phosphoadenosine 5'-phosphosulfate sulfotransferase (PAPS reductase)/FAD synthetase